MPGKFRRMAEKALLGALATVGIGVQVLDMLNVFERTWLAGVMPKITLLILSTVALYLLFEVDRFQALDTIEQRLTALDIPQLAQKLKDENYAGLVKVHPTFPDETFNKYIAGAESVTILNTWIPNLEEFEAELLAAVNRRAEVRVLLLHPSSALAGLRAQALRSPEANDHDDQVQPGVKSCLRVLERMHRQAEPRRACQLKVRVYNSLPSAAVYQADDRYLVSMFMHRQLAIQSPQFEIDGPDSTLAKQFQRELDTLWEIGRDVDMANWRHSIDIIRFN